MGGVHRSSRLFLLLLLIVLILVVVPSKAQNALSVFCNLTTADIVKGISPSLDSASLNTAFPVLLAQGGGSSNVGSSSTSSSTVKVDQLGHTLAGSSNAAQHFGLAVISTGNGQSVQWRAVVTNPTTNASTSVNLYSSPANSNIAAVAGQTEVQYSNLYGLFHKQANLSYSTVVEFLLLNPSQSLEFTLLNGALPASLSGDQCAANPNTSMQFIVLQWNVALAALPVDQFPLRVQPAQCGAWAFESLVYRLCPTVAALAGSPSPSPPPSSLLGPMKEPLTSATAGALASSVWGYCDDSTFSMNANTTYLPQCIIDIAPKSFDLATTAALGGTIEIRITMDDIITSNLSCWLTPLDNPSFNLSMKVFNQEEVILLRLSNVSTSRDTEFGLQCWNSARQNLLPANITIMATDFKKYIQYYPPMLPTFYVGDLQKSLTVVFSLALPQEFDSSPNCIVDAGANRTILGGQSDTPLVVSCDLSSHQFSLGAHPVWVIRSPDLWNTTLQYQPPLTITIEQRPTTAVPPPPPPTVAQTSPVTVPVQSLAPTTTTKATTTSTSAAITAAAVTTTSKPMTTPALLMSPPALFIAQSIQFADSLDSLIIDYGTPLSVNTIKGNCSICFGDLSKLGGGVVCQHNNQYR